jgi:hypothetical protein
VLSARGRAKPETEEMEIDVRTIDDAARAETARLRDALSGLVAVTGPENVTVRQIWEYGRDALLQTDSAKWLDEKLAAAMLEQADVDFKTWLEMLRDGPDESAPAEVRAGFAEHDAKVRVAALHTVQRERDAARAETAQLAESLGISPGTAAQDLSKGAAITTPRKHSCLRCEQYLDEIRELRRRVQLVRTKLGNNGMDLFADLLDLRKPLPKGRR